MKNGLLSVVMPVYNETNIEVGVKRVMSVLEGADIPYEIILVDDGSKNDSFNQISDLALKYDSVVAIGLSRNFGKEHALCAGLDNVSGDCCICMDSDMQHPPEYIPEMYRLWKEEKYEVVEGIKKARIKESIVYRLCAKNFYRVLNKMSGIDLQNASDFRLLDREALEAWKSLPERVPFFRGMSSWIGFRRTQVYFEVEEREFGETKWTLKGLIRLAIDSITSYSSVPLYFSTMFGAILMIFFFALFVQTLFMKINGHAQDGFTTVIILQLVIGAITMINIGIIGIYIKKIYEETKGRPRYIIRKIIKKEKENDNGITE